MTLKAALDIGIGCGLETVDECIYNIELHAVNLFEYSKINDELAELRMELQRFDCGDNDDAQELLNKINFL